MPNWKRKFANFMGLERDSVSIAEKLISAIGAMLSIFAISVVSYKFTGASGSALLVPSMGASAVLLFAVPHGKLSQPWPLLGGHLVSAAVGVTCHQFASHPFLAAGLAVGSAVALMYFLRCIHPPGGATALIVTVAGSPIQDLGYQFLLTPILLNAIIILVFAIIFNGFFPWRRYPAATLMKFTDTPQINHKDQSKYIVDKRYIEAAMKKMDLLVDIAMDDLQRLIQLTLIESEKAHLSPQQILLGHYYTNGKKGPEWSVRQIIDEASSKIPEHDMVIYRVTDGQGARSSNNCTRVEFANWASAEVFINR